MLNNIPQVMLIAHVDMDAFFAACEEKKNPELKSKPVIIGADPKSKRGIVSTCNYPARKFGIHSAMPISEAVRRCPKGVYIRGDYQYYKDQSLIIMKTLAKFGLMEQVSVDEAYIDITDYAKGKSLAQVGKDIKSSVLKTTSLSCSVGISNSRYVSKIASDFKKPGGIIVVKDAKKFLAPLSITKIPGVGKKSAPRILRRGVKTIGDIAALDSFQAKEVFGKWYLHLLRLATGNDETGIKDRGPRKSQSVERTYQEDKQKQDCLDDIDNLCKELNARMKNFSYKTIGMKIRFSGFHTITREVSLKTPTRDLALLKSTAQNIFERVDTKKKIRLIGVKVSNLSYNASRQMSLSEFLS